MKFNINNPVKVKLNNYGLEIHRLFYNSIFIGNIQYEKDYYPKIDENGYTKFQLGEIMQIFGPHIYHGGKVPFETEIELIEK